MCYRHVPDSGYLVLKRIIKFKYYIYAIASYNNNLIILCEESAEKVRTVAMIDTEGKVMWSVTRDSRGNNLFEWARLIPHNVLNLAAISL